jgi:N-acetylneuraminic acid mutarotase
MTRFGRALLLASFCVVLVIVAGCSGEADSATETGYTPEDTWKNLDTSGDLPPGRNWQSLVYDPATQRVILFGGRYGTNDLADTWTFDPVAGTWTELERRGSVPSARAGHAMVYDPTTGKVILFGGFNGSDCFGDTWAYNPGLNKWTDLHPTGDLPAPRYGHAMAYEPLSGKVILFGGYRDGLAYHDTWVYDPTANTWTERNPRGDLPPARYGHAMAYEAVSGTVIVHDGCDSTGSIFDDLWSYSLAANTWTVLEPTGEVPPARDWHAMVFDPANDRVVLFGGWSGTTVLGDTWSYDPIAETWTPLDPAGTLPPARDLHSLVYDLSRAKVLLFGGYDGMTHFNDVWVFGVQP